MDIATLAPEDAAALVEDLRRGIPPRRHTELYSTGYEHFVNAVEKRHLSGSGRAGKIRFVSGSWGVGKTHLFRLLRDRALESGYLVSSVELDDKETPFNKFERVLYQIVRNLHSREMAFHDERRPIAPLSALLKGALEMEACGDPSALPAAALVLKERLFADDEIDIDFRRVVAAYWDTFLPEVSGTVTLDERRGRLLQWFEGEGQKTALRKMLGVEKTVTKENARLILQSLAAFVRFLNYHGLVILFDESEMTHSTMRGSNLKQAHNNLLHLINEVSQIPGLFLVYAAVPEFFLHETTGIRVYPALAGRVGEPPANPPRALELVWNLDEMESSEADFQEAASKVRSIYLRAYPELGGDLISEDELHERVGVIVRLHPEYSRVSRWRVVIKETVKLLDQTSEGAPLSDPQASYEETVSFLERLVEE